jgi:hypothetical protein
LCFIYNKPRMTSKNQHVLARGPCLPILFGNAEMTKAKEKYFIHHRGRPFDLRLWSQTEPRQWMMK